MAGRCFALRENTVGSGSGTFCFGGALVGGVWVGGKGESEGHVPRLI